MKREANVIVKEMSIYSDGTMIGFIGDEGWCEGWNFSYGSDVRWVNMFNRILGDLELNSWRSGRTGKIIGDE